MSRGEGIAVVILFVVVFLGLMTWLIAADAKRRSRRTQAQRDEAWLAQGEAWNRSSQPE